MKKKPWILAGIALALMVSLFIPAFQNVAASALSIFRVGDTKTIQITLMDIEELTANLERAKADAPSDLDQENRNQSLDQAPASDFLPIGSIEEFTAFPAKLPQALSGELPQLAYAPSQSKTTTIDIVKINEELAQSGSEVRIEENFNGMTATVMTPPMLAAEYESVTLIQTQAPYVEAPDALKHKLKDIVVNAPLIPANIRSQLAAIDVNTRDIYLPVIHGVGREISVGGASGVVYAMQDIQSLGQALPGEFSSQMNAAAAEGHENGTILIWTQGDMLYALMGDMPENQLVSIARSLR